MQVDAYLNNATFYNVEKFDVVKGEKFSLVAVDIDVEIDWFANKDPVLLLVVTGDKAEVEAKEFGESIIFIRDNTVPDDDLFKVLKKLSIKVIPPVNQAVTLGTILTTIPKTKT